MKEIELLKKTNEDEEELENKLIEEELENEEIEEDELEDEEIEEDELEDEEIEEVTERKKGKIRSGFSKVGNFFKKTFNRKKEEELEDEEIEEEIEEEPKVKKGKIRSGLSKVGNFFKKIFNRKKEDELEDEEIEEVTERKKGKIRSGLSKVGNFFKKPFNRKKERKLEEARKLEEVRKAAEEAKKEAERAKKATEEMMKLEKERKAEEARKLEETKKAEEAKKLEEARKAERKAQAEKEKREKEETERKVKENYKHILNLIKLSVVYKAKDCLEKANVLHSMIRNSLTIRQNEDIKLQIELANVEIVKDNNHSFVSKQYENILSKCKNMKTGDMTLSNDIYKGFCERLKNALIYGSNTILNAEEELFNKVYNYLTISQSEDLKLKFENIRYNIESNAEKYNESIIRKNLL